MFRGTRSVLSVGAAGVAAVLLAAAIPSPAADGGALAPSWDKGLVLQTADKEFRIRVGGRIHQDWTFFTSQSDSLTRRFGDLQDGTEFRRARIHVDGIAYGTTEWRAEFDFGGGDASFREVYIGLRGVPGLSTLRLGHMQEPFSLEEITSSNYLVFHEYGLAGVFTPAYNAGLLLGGTFSSGRAGWAAGVFRDSDNYGKNSGDGKYAFTGRVVFAPVYSKEQKRVIHLGFSGSTRNPNGGVVRYSRKPEVNLAPNFVSTPSIAAKRVNLFGVETLVSQGRFFAQAEGIGSRVTRTGGGSATFTGGYAYAGWFLTNDHRPYKPGQGVADRVVPARNIDPRKSEWGALAVAGRVSYLDLDDSGIKGGTLTDGTLGLDWFLNPNTSVKAGYVIARPKGAGAMSAFQLRAQFDF